jgi:hypothetical protein
MNITSPLTANWIWNPQDSYTLYHQTILARKTFNLEQAASAALIRVTADGSYRLIINGHWVADGPARSWPEHFQYDQIDAAAYLQVGQNQIDIIARHWQTGDFHTRPQQAGLLVQIDLQFFSGESRKIISDASWDTACLPAWIENTPKVSIQMEPQELYDARLEDPLSFAPAAVLYPAGGGPWKDLHARDVALLNRKPIHFHTFRGATLIQRKKDLNFCLPAVRLAHPGVVEANRFVSASRGMAAIMKLESAAEIQIVLEDMIAAIDGIPIQGQTIILNPGRHFLCAFAFPIFSHIKERSLRIANPPEDLQLINPLDESSSNPWCDIALPEFNFQTDDQMWDWFDEDDGRRRAFQQHYERQTQTWLETICDEIALQNVDEMQVQNIPLDKQFVQDTHWAFINRQPISSTTNCVLHPSALMFDQGETTSVLPSSQGDVELCYDLGEQSVGFFELECSADAGVIIDLYAVEYITSDHRVQQTINNRNGLRYITRAGRNHFISLKRRAGRYLFITLRNQPSPIQFRLVRVIESTYPVETKAFFDCSDPRLRKVWEISARTLKLCMEDTFTDCPLYEQTHWVGDARNEAIFALDTYGATDIALRCLRLTAQSLERYPIVGAQVPSCWDMILPAWSFLWGIAVWDLFFYTGDRNILDELWPAMLRNIQGAEQMLDKNDLFHGKFWNMFDWTGVDDHHETVLHNSLLMVGAVDAAEKMAAVLNDSTSLRWLKDLRTRLTAAINHWWDPTRQSYPDSILENGLPSSSICQHTSFLALLYEVVSKENQAAALKNSLDRRPDMVQVGSPFAMMYLYEALQKYGQWQAILDSIYTNYLPMLEAGATTVWEVFPSSGDRPQGFPTRSHTHAWSSAPLHFLPQTILGIHQVDPGCRTYEVSPWLAGLDWAKGQICTAKGPLFVNWSREGSRFDLIVQADPEIEIRFVPNDSMNGLEITFSRVYERPSRT